MTREEYMANDDNPVLISFPRTGSHWLRLLCEIAFDRPIAGRSMLRTGADDFLFAYDHDEALDSQRENVIYLFRRNVVDVIYSYVSTPEGRTRNPAQIVSCAQAYARHLVKWLLDKTFTTRKTVVTYEDMQSGTTKQIARVAEHLDIHVDVAAVYRGVREATKERLHDISASWSPGLAPTGAEYWEGRIRFKRDHINRVRCAFQYVAGGRLDRYVLFTPAVDRKG